MWIVKIVIFAALFSCALAFVINDIEYPKSNEFIIRDVDSPMGKRNPEKANSDPQTINPLVLNRSIHDRQINSELPAQMQNSPTSLEPTMTDLDLLGNHQQREVFGLYNNRRKYVPSDSRMQSVGGFNGVNRNFLEFNRPSMMSIDDFMTTNQLNKSPNPTKKIIDSSDNFLQPHMNPNELDYYNTMTNEIMKGQLQKPMRPPMPVVLYILANIHIYVHNDMEGLNKTVEVDAMKDPTTITSIPSEGYTTPIVGNNNQSTETTTVENIDMKTFESINTSTVKISEKLNVEQTDKTSVATTEKSADRKIL